MSKVLIVDDDVTFCMMLEALLRKHSFEVEHSYSYADGRKKLLAFRPDIVLTDLRLVDHDGIEVLQLVKREAPEVPVILMTSYGDIRTAVSAMKHGAFDYVTKPVSPDEILATIHRALNFSAGEGADVSELAKDDAFIEGESEASLKILEHTALVAPTGMSVLIMGESGTGKEYVARRIHMLSQRSEKPFVAIDCGALPRDLAGSELFGHVKGSFTGAIADKPGQFEVANGGTIFLDEIGNLSYEIQIQLLRAIQERKIRRVGSTAEIQVDVRIITATNEDLKQAVARGDFREDLYHRINEFAIQVAPLRDRPEDMLQFATHFLAGANRELSKNIRGFAPQVIEIFSRYSWPGNLRELGNIIKRAVLLSKGDLITADTLPDELAEETAPIRQEEQPAAERPVQEIHPATEDADLRETSRRSEKELIVATLEKVRYNKSKAARILNVDRKTLYNKMKQFGIPLQ